MNTPKGRKSYKTLAIRVPSEIHDKIKIIAKRSGKTTSAYLRPLIEIIVEKKWKDTIKEQEPTTK